MTAPPRPAPLLPPSPEADRPLFLVVAILAALACLAGVGARAAWGATDAWTAQLEGAMTLYVHGDGGEGAQAAAARAAETAAALPGVDRARVLPQAEAAALVAAWLGEEALADLPVPSIVSIERDRTADATLTQTLTAALGEAGIRASVDDHARWSDPLKRASTAVRGLALLLLALLAAAAAAVTSFATRAGLAARREVVQVLHLVGAQDVFIAQEFTNRFTSLGLRAGALGALIAASAASILQIASSNARDEAERFLPAFQLAGLDAVILGGAPFITAAVAAATARATVLRALKRTF